MDELAAVKLEKSTRGQSKCRIWKEARSWRVTASRFGEICKATDVKNFDSLCENLFDPPA